MRPELAAIAARQNGVFLRRQATKHGYSDDEIKRQVKVGNWVRLRRGAYCERAVYEASSETTRICLVVKACALVLDPPAYASHSSALAVHELARYGVRTDQQHFTRPERHAGRKEAGVVHHEASLSASEVTAIEGIAVTSLERTALDVARGFGFLPGLVGADAALHAGADLELMSELAAPMIDWPDSRPMRAVLEHADAGGHSPGETLSRMVVIEAGFARPLTQFEVRDGDFLAYIDLVVEECNLAIEFDGKMKYRRTRDATDPAIDPGDVVWAEKLREDRLRDFGFEVVRIIWAELFGAQRGALIHRIQAAARRGAARRRVLLDV